MLLRIVAASLLSSVGSIAVASLLLALPERVRRTVIPWSLSYATGTLLSAAFLGLIPGALERLPALPVLGTTLGGMVLFFGLEKVVLWRHAGHDAPAGQQAAGALVLVGDGLHNFVDGAVLAGAFLTGTALGVAATVAVVAHEIPHEMGDFAILLDSGYSRARALVFNTLSGLVALVGALVAYLALESVRGAVPYILALSAASFLYIAAADLIPSLHRQPGLAAALGQLLLLLVGIATVASVELGGH